MNFDGIVGQNEVIDGLTNAVKNNKVGHAYVFNGPKGIGKKTIAGIFSEMLMCEKGGLPGSCGECMACRLLAGGSNPDLRIIHNSGGSIGIEEIRGIQSDIIIRPLYSKWKIYLIFDAGTMTVQAQNCLLKILEEPPHYAVIILTTSNYDALLETIRSRTLRFNFRKNTLAEVSGMLKDRFGTGLKGADFIASYADGVIGTAIELAGSDEFISTREKTIEILFNIFRSKLVDIFDIYDFFEANKNSIDTVLDIMLLVCRDILVMSKAGDQNMLINSDKKDIIIRNASVLSIKRVMKSIETIEMTRRNLKQNANYQLAIEVMLMKLQEE